MTVVCFVPVDPFSEPLTCINSPSYLELSGNLITFEDDISNEIKALLVSHPDTIGKCFTEGAVIGGSTGKLVKSVLEDYFIDLISLFNKR